MNDKEMNYTESYNIEDYERPSVAADMVVFTVNDKPSENPKKRDITQLKMMLIKRGENPYREYWALPGGFLKMDETIEECAARELKEETGLEHFFLKQFRTYSKVDRDPRGRIISCAYISLINNNNDIVKANSDAAAAGWFEVNISETDKGFSAAFSFEDDEIFSFIAEEAADNINITASTGKLAFDHMKIIADAIYFIRSAIENTEFIFSLLPEKFSIPQMQTVCSIIKGKSISKEVVHRLYDKKIEKTMSSAEGGQHKRAVLYMKKK